jgi:transposase
MEKFLTEQQRESYKKLHKQCKEKRIADRIKSILWLDDGGSYEEIAIRLMIDDATIRRWYEQFERGGINELMIDSFTGGQFKLSDDEQNQLNTHLEQRVYLNSKEVCEYVKEQYGIEYTSKGMTNLLHRMGFTYKKPKHLPGKSDRQAQETFIAQYEELKTKKNAEDKIYFMDGTHPMHNSQLSYGWIKKGKEQFIKANTGRKRININGAYDIENHTVIIREDESINAQSTVALLEQMLREQPFGILYIILDNARYYRSQYVQEFLDKNHRLQFIFLPAYSPNLNIIERLWKFVKKKVTYNKYYETFLEFREKILETFGNLENYKNELETLMTENFQLFPT